MQKLEAIYQDLITKLKTISTSAEYETGKNYETNLGVDVKDWDVQPKIDDDTPTVRIEDPLFEYEEMQEYSDHQPVDLNINIRIIVAPGVNAITELRKRGRDVFRCIGANKQFFLDKYFDTYFVPVSFEKMIIAKEKFYTGGLIIIKCKTNTEPWLIGETDY